MESKKRLIILVILIPIILIAGIVLYFKVTINYGEDVFTIRSETRDYLKMQYEIDVNITDVDYFFKGNSYTISFYVDGDKTHSLYQCYKRSDDSFDDTYLATFWTNRIEDEIYHQLQISGIQNIERPRLKFVDGLSVGSNYKDLVRFSKEITLYFVVPVEGEITEQYYQSIVDVINLMRNKNYALTELICVFKKSDGEEYQIVIDDPLKKEINIINLQRWVN